MIGRGRGRMRCFQDLPRTHLAVLIVAIEEQSRSLGRFRLKSPDIYSFEEKHGLSNRSYLPGGIKIQICGLKSRFNERWGFEYLR